MRTFLLALAFLLATSTGAWANIASGTDWTLATDGTLSIFSQAGMDDWEIYDYFANKDKVISLTIGESVTAIGDEAFVGCASLKTVSFAGTSMLRTIGAYAFSKTGLTSIKIPASVIAIGDRAFEGCADLATFYLPETPPALILGEGVTLGTPATKYIYIVDASDSVIPATDTVKAAYEAIKMDLSATTLIFPSDGGSGGGGSGGGCFLNALMGR